MSTETQARPFLSIVIPAHNEEHRLPGSLEKINTFLATQPYQAEIVIVENGSVDRTVEIVQELARMHSCIRLYQEQARGKGLAVRRGMLEAQGDYCFICDADLSMPIEQISRFLPPQLNDFDVAIGSREAPGSHRYNEPYHRHLMGRVLNWIVKITAVRGFEDTQCGFKMLSHAAAHDLFSVQQMNGIGFDVETIFIAQKRGYRIREIPIDWYFDRDSRMRLVGDTLHILREIYEIRRNWRKGVYNRRSDVN